MQSFTVDACCAYDMALASDGSNVWAAWYGNGETADNGVCKIDFPKLGKNTYKAKATKDDYAPGKVKLKVS